MRIQTVAATVVKIRAISGFVATPAEISVYVRAVATRPAVVKINVAVTTVAVVVTVVVTVAVTAIRTILLTAEDLLA